MAELKTEKYNTKISSMSYLIRSLYLFFEGFVNLLEQTVCIRTFEIGTYNMHLNISWLYSSYF